jgi:N-methylhydantoinase A/oxoprolinase/acetone carboxylase beta subunit
MMLTIGTDVGGTFTDLVAIDRPAERLLPRRFRRRPTNPSA